MMKHRSREQWIEVIVYSDVVGQAFYFLPDNCRMVLGQLPRAFRTHLDVPESPWNPGVWGWKTPKKVDWHFVRFRCGICPLMNRALPIFRAALRNGIRNLIANLVWMAC